MLRKQHYRKRVDLLVWGGMITKAQKTVGNDGQWDNLQMPHACRLLRLRVHKIKTRYVK